MTRLKAAAIPDFLASPDPRRPIVLFYGPDQGLSSQRAATLAQTLAHNAPESIMRLDGDALAADPDRLAEHAHAQNLFAPVRVIRVRDGVQSLMPSIKPLLADPPSNLSVLIEAGDLKKGAPLRKAIEESDVAVAIPSYPDTDHDIARLIDDMVLSADKSIAPLARDALIERLGSDHAVSRSEIEKLLTYVGDKTTIDDVDIAAVCGDSAAAQLDAFSDAIGSGLPDVALDHLRRLTGEGVDESRLLTALIRHFSSLYKVLTMRAGGETIQDALRSFRPPLHFRQRDALQAHAKTWSLSGVETALTLLFSALNDSRRDAELAPIIASRVALRLAETARRSVR